MCASKARFLNSFLLNKALNMWNDTRQKISKLYHEYPRTFWVVIAITFIDRIGGSLLFPFFALYITSKFEVGMTQVGVLFAAFSLSSFAGTTMDGALTDRFGTRRALWGCFLHLALLPCTECARRKRRCWMPCPTPRLFSPRYFALCKDSCRADARNHP